MSTRLVTIMAITRILAYGVPGAIELLVVGVVAILPILFVVWVVRRLINDDKERRRMRLEIGKLADELYKLQQKIEPEKNGGKE